MLLFIVPIPLLGYVIFTPLLGALVRYRANYDPKNVQLDGESPPPLVTGYFDMLRRIYRLEGWTGLYKGSTTCFLFYLLLHYTYSYLFSFLDFVLYSVGLQFRLVSISLFFARMIFTLAVGIPTTTLLYRAMCTPYVVPWFSPRTELSLLLSPTERRKPWKLYLTPGLLLAHILVAIPVKAIETSGFLLWGTVSRGHLLLSVLILLLTSLLLSPLPVIIVRLSLQRNHDHVPGVSPESESRTEAEQATVLGLQEYSRDEDVIGLRDEDDTYTSLYDCFTRMNQEEGWGVFFRAYWATLLGNAQWLLLAVTLMSS